MPAGRPSKYTEELLTKAWDYTNGGWKCAGDAMPSICGLADHLNLDRSTIYDWAEDPNKEISDMLGRILTKQEKVLFNESLKGEYNATIAKLALTKHGYHDKSDSTLSGPGGKPIPVQEVPITFTPVGPDDV